MSAQCMVLGVDPGLAKTGYALAAVDIDRASIRSVHFVGVIETKRSMLRTVRRTSDDLRRARVQASAFQQILACNRVDMVAAEMATTTPYTYPTFSFGVMIGILAALERPLIEVLPYEVKAAASGSDRATKREIIAWALALPAAAPLAWPTSQRSNRLGLTYCGRNVTRAAEHPADALAAIQAALWTEQIQLARSLMTASES